MASMIARRRFQLPRGYDLTAMPKATNWSTGPTNMTATRAYIRRKATSSVADDGGLGEVQSTKYFKHMNPRPLKNGRADPATMNRQYHFLAGESLQSAPPQAVT